MSLVHGANSKLISGAQVIVSGNGVVYGFIVNSHSSGTIKLWDNTEASGRVLIDTYTFVSGSSVVKFPAGLTYQTGLFADISVDESVTIVFN